MHSAKTLQHLEKQKEQKKKKEIQISGGRGGLGSSSFESRHCFF